MNAPQFSYMPLFLIKRFEDKNKNQRKKKAEDPNILLMTPKLLKLKFLRMSIVLTSLMDTEFHKPGDVVIVQNDAV